ncbi:hypothetical protein [Methylobacter svalbardensis]|uniref:hypothetical protein n=1 Tax=Methylobacter svalbardensis TaxID=3080016 RepID=UPI0030EBE144
MHSKIPENFSSITYIQNCRDILKRSKSKVKEALRGTNSIWRLSDAPQCQRACDHEQRRQSKAEYRETAIQSRPTAALEMNLATSSAYRRSLSRQFQCFLYRDIQTGNKENNA